MRKKVSNLIVIASQLLLVGLFFMINFNDEINDEKHVSIIHNDNLNKIATSVSLLFKEEIISVEEKMEDLTLEELPSIDKITEEVEKLEKELEENVNESIPLVSVDASKYSSVESMGFKVSEGNKEYSLTDDEFDVVVAVVAGEFDENLNDALAVVSVILNRCDAKSWAQWAGGSPYDQVVADRQFEVYFKNYYLSYMPGGSNYESNKYEIAKQAVIDGLNGIRNNKYLYFRAWNWKNSNGDYYSNNYIVFGGNRYRYEEQ